MATGRMRRESFALAKRAAAVGAARIVRSIRSRKQTSLRVFEEFDRRRVSWPSWEVEGWRRRCS